MWEVPSVEEPLLLTLRRFRPRSAPRSRSLPLRSCGWGALTGFVLVVAVIVIPMVGNDHLHAVQNGRVYRSAQMSPKRLEEVIRRLGIRTVVNLRGACPDFDWYRQECRVTAHTDISQEDVTFSAIRLPPKSEVRRLIEILDRAEYPILLHCRQGVDRTGLASAIVRLLDSNSSLADAEKQLSIAYGYVAWNGTESMREFLRLYRDWLERLPSVHTPELFRYWATVEYCPGLRRGRLESCNGDAITLQAHQGATLPVRVTNTSTLVWQLRRGVGWGVRVEYSLLDASRKLVFQGRAGLVEQTIGPGESNDLPIGLPPLHPGHYCLYADLIGPDGNAFCQFGNDPLMVSVSVIP
jgi:protein tyrosine phosphatase (PTP) superfamily phosphohydrolase (DUF442 family)